MRKFLSSCILMKVILFFPVTFYFRVPNCRLISNLLLTFKVASTFSPIILFKQCCFCSISIEKSSRSQNCTYYVINHTWAIYLIFHLDAERQGYKWGPGEMAQQLRAHTTTPAEDQRSVPLPQVRQLTTESSTREPTLLCRLRASTPQCTHCHLQ